MKLVRVCLSLITQGGQYLVVWNKPVSNWTFPGGKIEPGETLFECNRRELMEETGLAVRRQKLIYTANYDSTYGSPHTVQVNFLSVLDTGEPKAMEKDCPIGWLSREWLLTESPFAEFNKGLFKKIDELGNVF